MNTASRIRSASTSRVRAGILPVTMERYRFQGTPSAVIIGRDGTLLHQSFGAEDDMIMGARIASALSMPAPMVEPESETQADGCADGVCPVPA